MLAEIHALKDQYISWLKESITLHELDGWVEVTTPFIDRHNDYLQFYVGRSDSGYILSDDGYTIVDLEQSGCQLNTTRRQSLLAMTLRGYGVKQNAESKELYVDASSANYARRKHSLIQAMLAVNDLYYLASPHVASFYFEDVEAWLEAQGIRYSPSVKLTGASGFDHHFDFVIPKSASRPERVLLSLNRPDRANIERTVFAWEDTKKARRKEACAYAILNDAERAISEDSLSALKAYQVNPVLWSERESVLEELAA